MLQHTFCHLDGIGRKTEERLWEAGILSWQDWQDPPPICLKSTSRIEAITVLEKSLAALENNPDFFTDKLAANEHWRLFPHYREKTAYLDIETTGLGESSEITTIALYDGQKIRTYVNGINLEAFVEDISHYQILVTYNGRSFDIPFIENYFNITLEQAQIDLRYVLSKMGYRGGLKGCEKAIGINRNELDGVDGYFAVLLWYEYENYNSQEALETLLAYNTADTVNLETLLIHAYNHNTEATPFAEEVKIAYPVQPLPIHMADLKVVDHIKNKYLKRTGR